MRTINLLRASVEDRATCNAKVWFDGAPLSYCVAADAEAGWVDVRVRLDEIPGLEGERWLGRSLERRWGLVEIRLEVE
jgi:hypothetical protein